MQCDNDRTLKVVFTEREDEFATLLIQIGTRKNIAKSLVFLANTRETTSHAIERGTDMRQPEVSLAMRYFAEKGWITARESESESKGRPVKIYTLAKPLQEIMDCIEKEKVHKRTTSSPRSGNCRIISNKIEKYPFCQSVIHGRLCCSWQDRTL